MVREFYEKICSYLGLKTKPIMSKLRSAAKNVSQKINPFRKGKK
jgi:hypothetical protein